MTTPLPPRPNDRSNGRVGVDWRRVIGAAALLLLSLPLGVALFFETPWVGVTPEDDEVLTGRAAPLEMDSYELPSGATIDRARAASMVATTPGQRALAPEAGAVHVTPELVALGRRTFYQETFGNEVFFTEVLGLFDGPISPLALARAVAAQHGGFTTNLRVELDRDVTVAGMTFREGTLVDTGLDVPRGARVPLGLRMRISGGHVQVGVTCAACHATVDSSTGRVIEGAPNADLNIGLLLAFAPNSAAMFRHTGVDIATLPATGTRYVDAAGVSHRLPDARALEDAVDADLLAWPPGTFDATPDRRNDPAQIPSSYAYGAFPYGWSGFAATGWFRGLTSIGDFMHASTSDPTRGAATSQPVLGLSEDAYLGIILQASASRRFRLRDGERPLAAFDRVDPNPGVPGLTRVVRAPDFPEGSPFTLDGLMVSPAGRPFASQLNALAAFQSTLAPPPTQALSSPHVREGAAVFARAGCPRCHEGRWFTNHAVIPASEIGTQPLRAAGLAAYAPVLVPPRTWPPDSPVPIPEGVSPLIVPIDAALTSARGLAFAQLDPAGGYKVPSLVGLAVTAPYLHDGGVAAAADALVRAPNGEWMVAREDRVGASGTVMHAVPPDPEASLRALLDRRLRAAVIERNRSDVRLRRANVEGTGHAFWIDVGAGFTVREQDAVVAFLLSIDDEPEVLP